MAAEDLFDEKRDPGKEAAPTLAEVIRQAVEAKLVDMRVSMPAEVIKYDHSKQLADVRPYFKRKYPDGEVLEAPTIYNVPVGHPRSGNAFIHLPVKKGDTVNLVVMDRSVDKWLTSGTQVDPEDVRSHDLSDAWAYPGVYPFNKPFSPANGDDLIIKNSKGEIRVKSNGKFQMLGSGDLISAIHALAQATLSVAGVVDGNHGSSTSGDVSSAMNKIGNFKA